MAEKALRIQLLLKQQAEIHYTRSMAEKALRIQLLLKPQAENHCI